MPFAGSFVPASTIERYRRVARDCGLIKTVKRSGKGASTLYSVDLVVAGVQASKAMTCIISRICVSRHEIKCFFE